MAYTPSAEAINQHVDEHKIGPKDINELLKERKSFSSRAHEYIDPIAAGATGVGHGLYNAVAGVANLPSALGFGKEKIKPLEESESMKEHPLASGIGNALSFILPGIGQEATAAKLASYLPRVFGRGVAPIASRTAATEFATQGGEVKDRSFAAALGASGAGAASLLSNISKLRMKEIAKTGRKNIKNLSKRYDKVLEDGVDGATHKTPTIDKEKLAEFATNKESKPITNYLDDGNLQSAHQAQSQANSLQRAASHKGDLAQQNPLASVAKRQSLQDEERFMEIAKKKIRNSIREDFLKRGSPEKAKEYAKVTTDYAKKGVQYNHPAIKKFEQGRISADQAISELKSSPEVWNALVKQHPRLKSLGMAGHARKAAALTAILALPGGGGDYIRGLLHKLI